jgi:hypothetical protein
MDNFEVEVNGITVQGIYNRYVAGYQIYPIDVAPYGLANSFGSVWCPDGKWEACDFWGRNVYRAGIPTREEAIAYLIGLTPPQKSRLLSYGVRI